MTEHRVPELPFAIDPALFGDGFLQAACDRLRVEFDADFAFVGALRPLEYDRVFVQNMSTRPGLPSFDIYETCTGACHQVIQSEGPITLPGNAQEVFPDNLVSKELGITSYAGLPLFNAHNVIVGVAVLEWCRKVSQKELTGVVEAVRHLAPRLASEVESGLVNQKLNLMLDHDDSELTGDVGIFRSIALQAASATDAACAFVGECVEEDPTLFRILARVVRGELHREAEGVLVPYEMTPCRNLKNQDTVCVPNNLDSQYPESAEFYHQYGLESYYGRAFYSRDGRQIGHIALLHDRPMSQKVESWQPFALVRHRAQLELRGLEAARAAKLRAERERDFLNAFLETIPIPVFLKTDEGTFASCNTQWAQFLGLPMEKVIGATSEQVTFARPSPPLLGSDQQVIETQKTGVYPGSLVVQGGEEKDVICYKAPFTTLEHGQGIIGAVIDITEQKEIERDLRLREIMLREATEVTKTAFAAYSLNTRQLSFATDSLRHVLGVPLSSKSVEGTTIDQYFKCAELALDGEMRKSIKAAEETGQGFEFVSTVTDSKNLSRSLRLKGYPLPFKEGHRSERGIFIQDITEELAMEARIEQLNKFEALGKLTGGVAHDFNNLLAVVLGNAELLSVRESYDVQLVNEIIVASKRGEDLTGSLLAYARKQTLQTQSVHLGQRCGSMQAILQRTLSEEIKLTVTCPDDLWFANVDPGKFEDAILNLALNARDAMPEGGSLEIKLENVLLPQDGVEPASEEGLAGDYVSISVADTGSGIAPDVLKRVLDPFFTTKSTGKGSGLGLSRVYGFARQSNGDMTIESEPGKGTKICLYLPRHEDQPDQETPTNGVKVPKLAHKKHVVVVEDDPAVRLMTERMLETLGYTTTSFERAAYALKHLRAGHPADVLLTDVVLADGMRGTALAQVVQDDFPNVGVLLMSGYTSEDPNVDHKTAQDFTLLNKPIMRKDLAAAIDRAIEANTTVLPVES